MKQSLEQKGFTLMELMITVAIVAILAAVAMPSYKKQTQKGSRTDGTTALLNAASLQERWYTLHNTYADDISDVGGSTTERGYYTIAVTNPSCGTTTFSCFTLTATAVAGQPQASDTGCTTLTLKHTGEKTPTACW